ncbi:piggyBac transposable element-derived protein 3-like [Phymastichus coffea]|uniref:piggyBac transposable element-derived protein 3-like n=1 Tax=Phymastichus coffea TaxID=108790 RepID=UPI00273B195B|nr:piggyBac transposable element-derived protein 3-like [Phymastichus coffea]
MPKRKNETSASATVSKNRHKKKYKVSSSSIELDEEENYDEAVFIPNPDSSGESDGDDSRYENEDFDDSENEVEEFFPSSSYRKVLQGYEPSQKKLEDDHQFVWVDGEKKYHSNLKMKYYYIKQYIIEATKINGYDLTPEKLNAFLGILIFTMFNKRLSQRDYWSKDPFLGCALVPNVMSRDEFEEIKSKLKLSKPEDEDSNDRVWRVRSVFNIFRKNLLIFGVFATALSIDEMMLKFFGKTVLKQFIKSKPIRFGIKLWALCSANGYVFDCDIYCGKNSENNDFLPKCALGSRVVMQMLQNVLENISIKKLIHLHKIGIQATGTVRENRINVKNNVDKKDNRGTYAVKHDTESGINFITVVDSKPVSILSTAAGVTPLSIVKRFDKEQKQKSDISFPHAFSVYNKFMGGVDIHDQRCNKVVPIVRSKKWTWIILMRMIQSSITNSVVLRDLTDSEDKKHSTKSFALSLAKHYMAKKDFKGHKWVRSRDVPATYQNRLTYIAGTFLLRIATTKHISHVSGTYPKSRSGHVTATSWAIFSVRTKNDTFATKVDIGIQAGYQKTPI